MTAPLPASLDLALIGNAAVSALIDARGDWVWACHPRVDADPVFCALLEPHPAGGAQPYDGRFAVELLDGEGFEQHYLPNTAVLVTRLTDRHGGAIEIIDCAPRFRQYGRLFHPAMLVRRVRRVAGNPRLCVHARPLGRYGAERPAVTSGSHHVRYAAGDTVLRLTTDCSISAVLEETPFVPAGDLHFVIGVDEPLQDAVGTVVRRFVEDTTEYWRDWVRDLAIPFEWQDAIIRAAITLKLSAVDDTGALVAALTTSIPEAADSARNWDYRFCWLRDAYFTVNALNRLNATRTMERYLGYILNLVAEHGSALQPCYGVSGLADLPERVVGSLSGYRGMGPVRIGNQAHLQRQHDVWGSAILAATHAFFDRRLMRRDDIDLFTRLEPLGEAAFAAWDQPDAGLWELRGSAHVHTFSAVMCWAACDRLARIAAHLGLADRAAPWRSRADVIRAGIHAAAWNERRGSYCATFGGDALDASLLLLPQLGFIEAADPRFGATLDATERELKRGDFVYRYVVPDDFGAPENAFLVCTFWYVDALAAVGRLDEARALFERLLARRNRVGLLAEHIAPASGELWGNFPQTYSMVGLINCATRLSLPWDRAF
jgi:GH15 family glucan-1,4-alpha-glucosidase